MNSLRFIAPFALLIQLCAAADAPPAKALKYHEVLLKKPSSETLFDRFFGAWIDEQDVDTLEAFLAARAAKNGGADLSVFARFQLRRGSEDAALETFGKAIAALPQDFSLRMERAKILLRRLEFENARKDLAIVSAGTDAVLALESSKLIGKSWLREGKPEQAIKGWDKLLATNPGDEDLLEDLVESAAAEGETEQALKYLDTLIAAGSDPYKKTLRQLRRGDLLAKAGRHDDSVSAYSTTLAAAGEGSWLEREILAQIDKAFRKQDRINELKDKLVELARANPNRLLIHRELARIEAAQGETDAAIGRFHDVLKRTPGNRELRQEFVRLLTDGEKYQEATVELQKLIELAPQDSALLLQMADLHNREGNKETTLAALAKAHTLLGVEDESASVRIAGLMFQYGLGEAGEKLLLKFTAKENASEAPSEALAAEYARTNRKPEALAILEKIAASDNLDTVLRTYGTISALGQSATALKVLAAKEKNFNEEPRFLAAISQAALAAGKPEIAVTHAVKLVRLATLGSDLKDRITLALRAIADANQTDEWRTTLEKQAARSLAETCLFAALADSQSDFDAVSKIMGGTNDPSLVRFHAALLDRRNEFEQAITVLKSLAETPEGRKASYLKDMTDLQRRAGLTDDALATVELWKQRAPGDKTAWVTGSSILREEGRSEEAVKVTRQAVSRFEEDKDLAATLAALHEEAGQMENAEAIYWRLYDQAESPADQARWSVRLAELSMSTGRSEELEEKLRERARSNRLSIGPILAQAELARITRDENKRRDLLLEAVRLQPKDIDLRLQIANLEEQSGSPERAIAILEEAAPTDTTNNIRRALAQAYLRQGQTLKGMRELRALAGKQSDDPRNVEKSAAALAGSGLYDEAIRFLRETLPDGGDWRTRYLLAVMLEHDGRESEAIPIFQTLRQTTTEIPSLLPPATNTPQQKKPRDESSESVREIIRIMISKQAAYSHRSPNNYQGAYIQGGAMVGPFILPDNIESLHSYSLVHLTKLGAEGLENNDFIKELISIASDDSPDFAAMLTKYPEHPGLLEMVLLYASSNRDRKEINPDLLRKLIASRKDLSTVDRFRANFILVTSPNAAETAWDEFIAAAKPLTDLKEKNANEISGIAYQILMLLSQEEIKIPEKSHKELSEIILGIAASQNLDSGYMQGFKLAIFCAIGTTEQWIDAANKEIDTFRKEEAHSNRSAVNPNANIYGSNRRGINNPWMNGNESPFSIPTIESVEFASLPAMIPRMIRQSSKGRSFSRTMEPSRLLAKIDTITSPLLRAWVAIRSGDKAAMDKYLQATPSDTEAADFASLRTLNALEKKDFTAAYKFISGQRAALASDRNRITSLNFQLLAIAAEMSPEQRKEIDEELGQLLLQSRRTLGIQGAPILAEQAERLGLTDLAKRFLPAAAKQLPRNSAQGPASFSNNQSSSSSSGNPSIDKLKKFAKEGKKEAAALEALNLIRKALLDQRNRSYEISEIREVITQDVLAEVMKLIEPGNSESLTKLTEYADICINFGKPDQALAVLNRLHTARPKDAAIAAKLAFILPATERDRAIKLISSAVNDPNFAQIAFEFGFNLSEDENNESTFKYFETTTQWLETANPDDHQKTNLTWASYLAKEFFDGDYFENRNNLSESDPAQLKNNKDFQRFAAVAKRLGLAMLRHASIAEEGFRLSRYSRAWTFTDAELDHYARSALMAGASLRDPSSRNLSFFDYRNDGGSSSSGEELAELSSVGWLISRLATAKSPDDIFPPAYLSQLREKNPQFGEITTAIAGMKNVAELEKLWKSDALDKSSGPFAEMLREGVLSKASAIPGAGDFFLKLLQEIKPGSMSSRNFNGQSNAVNLVIAALNSSRNAEAKVLNAMCSAISKALFGEKIDLSSTDKESTYVISNGISTLASIFRKAVIAPEHAIRVQKIFYKLGIPVASSQFSILESFSRVKPKKVADAEKIFASYGWLDPIENWQPYAAILADDSNQSGKLTFTRKESFLLPAAINFMSTSFPQSELITFLEKRQPQTFGALITAASIAEGPERARLTALAFSTNAAKMASMTPERIAEFSFLLPWLPKDAIAALPPAFRKKAEGANTDRLAKLSETADAFLKNNQRNNNSYRNDPFNEVEDLVSEIAPLDLPKATAVFLEAERRYTESLSRGGRFSSYMTSGLQNSQRDEAFDDLITDRESPMEDPAIALAFYNAIASSPAASRFSFSTDRSNTSVLLEIGSRIFSSAAQGSNPKEQRWMRALKSIQMLPEELQPAGYLAIGSYLNGRYIVPVLRNHYTPDEFKKLPEPARVVLTIFVGMRNWENDNPAHREATRNALNTIVTDSKIPFPTRFQFISIAVTMKPSLLADLKTVETYTSIFEEYAKGERSIVSSIGIFSAIVIRHATESDDIKPLLSRIYKAFWDNANSSKPGGHPTIPQDFVNELLSSAAIAGDEVNAKKLAVLAKQSSVGNILTIYALIASGNHESAKQMLAPVNRIYSSTTEKPPLYTKSFEQKFKDFSKTPGLDAVALLRLEVMLMDGCPAADDGRKPLESDAQREQRIIESYMANKPTDLMHRTEIVGRLTRDSHTAAIALHDEVIALSKLFDLKKILEEWYMGTGSPSDPSPRYILAPTEAVIMRQAAFLRMLDGDASGLAELFKAMEDQPEAKSYHANGVQTAIRDYHQRVCISAPLWIAVAVHLGKTEGFAGALESFANLVLLAEKRPEMDSWDVTRAIIPAEFLAYWNGQPEKFQDIRKQIKRYANQHRYLRDRWGLLQFVKIGSKHKKWNHPSFATTRCDFFVKAFSRKEMTNFYGTSTKCLSETVSAGNIRADIMKIAENPPEGIVPNLLTQLIHYRSNEEFNAKHFDSGVALAMTAIQTCPEGREGDSMRFEIQASLLDKLIANKKFDNAKEVYAAIKTDPLNDGQKKRYQVLGEKLTKAPQ